MKSEQAVLPNPCLEEEEEEDDDGAINVNMIVFSSLFSFSIIYLLYILLLINCYYCVSNSLRMLHETSLLTESQAVLKFTNR
jgi:hypothetical protein